MADFDFLDGFDADGDWGFTSVKSKPATESKAESDATKEVVKTTADNVGKAVSSEIINRLESKLDKLLRATNETKEIFTYSDYLVDTMTAHIDRERQKKAN